MAKEVPFIGRESLCPAERMDEFGSGGIEHMCDVLDAIGSGTQSLLHRLNFIIIPKNIHISRQ
jgi:hypothetical protein